MSLEREVEQGHSQKPVPAERDDARREQPPEVAIAAKESEAGARSGSSGHAGRSADVRLARSGTMLGGEFSIRHGPPHYKSADRTVLRVPTARGMDRTPTR
jgi:hypothetical protein